MIVQSLDPGIFQAVLRKWRIREEVIPPGQPYDSGHMKSFHGTMREEVLNREEFEYPRGS